MELTNAIGRRKASVARVYIKKGAGNITVNDKDYKEYFPVLHLRDSVVAPLKTLGFESSYDITVNVSGGGVKGQAEAVRLGISRGLVKIDAENKPKLKTKGFLTRDSRKVERKKPGLKKARKSEQFSKR